MHIILTHEQGDFDAIASLMGAYLLDDSLVPVLPRRINRNARAFLTLYGMELPFIDPRDLPPEPIDAVTLVDTQAMVTLSGVPLTVEKDDSFEASMHIVPRFENDGYETWPGKPYPGGDEEKEAVAAGGEH